MTPRLTDSVISAEDCWNRGLVGRVVYVDGAHVDDRRFARFLVQFDNLEGRPAHGHGGLGHGEKPRCWWFYTSDLDYTWKLLGGPW